MLLALSAAAGAAVSYWAFPEFARLYWQRLSNTGLGFFMYTEGTLSGRLARARQLLAEQFPEYPDYRLRVRFRFLPYVF